MQTSVVGVVVWTTRRPLKWKRRKQKNAMTRREGNVHLTPVQRYTFQEKIKELTKRNRWPTKVKSN